jgi:hypothetical protein
MLATGVEREDADPRQMHFASVSAFHGCTVELDLARQVLKGAIA